MSELKRQRRPSAPGQILRKLYMTERHIQVGELAEATGISRKHMSRIINGHASVTAETAGKLAQVLQTTPQLWMNLQMDVDLFDAEQSLKSWQPAQVWHTNRALAEAG